MTDPLDILLIDFRKYLGKDSNNFDLVSIDSKSEEHLLLSLHARSKINFSYQPGEAKGTVDYEYYAGRLLPDESDKLIDRLFLVKILQKVGGRGYRFNILDKGIGFETSIDMGEDNIEDIASVAKLVAVVDPFLHRYFV